MMLVKSPETVLRMASSCSISEVHSLPCGFIPLVHSHHFSSWQSIMQNMSISVCLAKTTWKEVMLGFQQLATLVCNSL